MCPFFALLTHNKLAQIFFFASFLERFYNFFFPFLSLNFLSQHSVGGTDQSYRYAGVVSLSLAHGAFLESRLRRRRFIIAPVCLWAT